MSGPAVIDPSEVASAAEKLAAANGNRLTPFVLRTPQAKSARCPWHLVGLAQSGRAERAAVAWTVADAIMKERSGHTKAYDLWRTAAISGSKLTGDDARRVTPFVQPVFGLPPDGNSAKDHVPGFVGEWLWYLATREENVEGHELALLDPPSWNVTEGGGDGFVVHRTSGGSDTVLMFRLWEIKKFTGVGSINNTITRAATQIAARSEEYLAKISWANKDKPDDLGLLMSELTELWMRADRRAGAGVSVATDTSSAPTTAFAQVSEHLPRLDRPGQLRGLIMAVDDFTAFAAQVRRYVWSAL